MSEYSGEARIVPIDKWKTIQFAKLDVFEDSDEELKKIGMTPLDIRQFRDWQKSTTFREFRKSEVER